MSLLEYVSFYRFFFFVFLLIKNGKLFDTNVAEDDYRRTYSN